MSKPYAEHLIQARRYDKCVNFGSPTTAWTLEMLKEYRKARKENRQPEMRNCK